MIGVVDEIERTTHIDIDGGRPDQYRIYYRENSFFNQSFGEYRVTVCFVTSCIKEVSATIFR